MCAVLGSPAGGRGGTHPENSKTPARRPRKLARQLPFRCQKGFVRVWSKVAATAMHRRTMGAVERPNEVRIRRPATQTERSIILHSRLMYRTGSGTGHGTMIQAGPPGHEAFRPSAGSSSRPVPLRPVPLRPVAACCRAQLLQFHVASSELACRTGSTVAALVNGASRPSCRPCRGWPSKGWPSRGERPAGLPLAAKLL